MQLGRRYPVGPGHAQPADGHHHRRTADGAFRREHSLLALSARPAHRGGDHARGDALHKEGITINIFLLQSWNQSEEDVRFAYRMAETTKGRVIFTAGRDLDRFVVWDYIKMRKSIVA